MRNEPLEKLARWKRAHGPKIKQVPADTISTAIPKNFSETSNIRRTLNKKDEDQMINHKYYRKKYHRPLQLSNLELTIDKAKKGVSKASTVLEKKIHQNAKNRRQSDSNLIQLNQMFDPLKNMQAINEEKEDLTISSEVNIEVASISRNGLGQCPDLGPTKKKVDFYKTYSNQIEHGLGTATMKPPQIFISEKLQKTKNSDLSPES